MVRRVCVRTVWVRLSHYGSGNVDEVNVRRQKPAKIRSVKRTGRNGCVKKVRTQEARGNSCRIREDIIGHGGFV